MRLVALLGIALINLSPWRRSAVVACVAIGVDRRSLRPCWACAARWRLWRVCKFQRRWAQAAFLYIAGIGLHGALCLLVSFARPEADFWACEPHSAITCS